MFGGFKATMNLFGGKKNKKEGRHSELSPDMCVSGAYRTSRDDFYGYNNSYDQQKRATSEQLLQQIRPTKSTSDLAQAKNPPPQTRNSIPEVSRDPRGAEQIEQKNGAQKNTKSQDKEQKKLEKQRIAEQKAREKQAAQEQAKQEKLRREREKKETQQNKQKRERRPEKKRQAPKPTQPQAVQAAPVPQGSQYSTNTLESSISRSSGPPPYSDGPMNAMTQSTSDKTGNVMYSKPVDTGSWDMISQHRQQTIRPTTTIGSGKQSKQMVMDLNYNFGANTSQSKDNSDA